MKALPRRWFQSYMEHWLEVIQMKIRKIQALYKTASEIRSNKRGIYRVREVRRTQAWTNLSCHGKPFGFYLEYGSKKDFI